jgi:hypothetical protein
VFDEGFIMSEKKIKFPVGSFVVLNTNVELMDYPNRDLLKNLTEENWWVISSDIRTKTPVCFVGFKVPSSYPGRHIVPMGSVGIVQRYENVHMLGAKISNKTDPEFPASYRIILNRKPHYFVVEKLENHMQVLFGDKLVAFENGPILFETLSSALSKFVDRGIKLVYETTEMHLGVSPNELSDYITTLQNSDRRIIQVAPATKPSKHQWCKRK